MGQTTGCCQATAEAQPVEQLEPVVAPQDQLTHGFVDILNKDEVSTNTLPAKADEENLTKRALEEAERHLRDFNLDRADEVLGTALEQLSEASAERLRSAETFRRVQRHLGQYELAKDMLASDDFELLWQQDGTRMEVKRDPCCRVFEYRLVIDLEQPLSQAVSHFEEVDLIHKVQKQLCQPVETLGSGSPWHKAYMMCFSIAVLRIEVLHELFRYRDKTNGVLLEGVCTEFDHTALNVPAKSWRAMRPWNIAANLWKPHEDGSGRTTFIHVSRAEAGMTLASWMLDTAAYFVARGFAADVRKAAAEASVPGSPWMERINADKDGFYAELREIEKVRSTVPWDKRALAACTLRW
ncbi:unnamed protein product [Symbiodinium natans]|uniref:Uncharacterized protein n=1 Tax=Symbiodinium natans TaxID=878477 RepID=A0A812GWA8_9DINO|nr:unnamed protein product [Symbiodinium natans]